MLWCLVSSGQEFFLRTSHRGHMMWSIYTTIVFNNMVYKTEIQAWGNIRSKKNNQQHWRKCNQISLVNKTLTQFRGYLVCLGSNPHIPTYCTCEFWQIINTSISVTHFPYLKNGHNNSIYCRGGYKIKEIVNVKYKVQCLTRHLCSKNDGYFSLIIGAISY